MRLSTFGLALILATAGISALLAQNVEGLDIQAIKQRSLASQAEAQAFVEEVKDRGDAFRADAVEAHQGGTENMKRVAATDLATGPTGPIDFDAIVGGAAQNLGAKTGEAPQFIAFASLSMPPASLRQMIRDTAAAGGIVVFRGFPDNSMKAFAARLGKLVEEQEFGHIGIDPRLFRTFDVQAVPTYVAVSSDFDLCAGFDCRTRVPPHDRITGNVTVRYALESFVDGQGPGGRVAAVARSNLDRRRP